MSPIRASAFVVPLFAWQAVAGGAIATSTFDSDLDGWTLAGNPSLSHQATGGNPGGFALYNDTGGPLGDGWLVAPSAYLGDWTDLEGVGSLSWDHRMLVTMWGADILTGQATISGPAGSAFFDSGLSFAGQWQTFVAPISASSWQITGGTWNGLLANVTDLRLRLDATRDEGLPGEADGMDSVALVPEPSSLLLLIVGGLVAGRSHRP